MLAALISFIVPLIVPLFIMAMFFGVGLAAALAEHRASVVRARAKARRRKVLG